jgi:hypothetical protein
MNEINALKRFLRVLGIPPRSRLRETRNVRRQRPEINALAQSWLTFEGDKALRLHILERAILNESGGRQTRLDEEERGMGLT